MSLGSSRPNSFDVRSMQPLQRSNSTSSDIMSTSNSGASSGTTHTAPAANPPPAYIAQNEASDLISAELERKVTLAPLALTSLNDFLDSVLYNILTASHSVALGHLKAAVSLVLKPRLGKAALKVAEEELKEYMEEGEEEELSSIRMTAQPSTDFDTELVWKLARLRCMVYARMGDLEEEDEEEWLEKEHLLQQVSAARRAGKPNIEVGPAAAIFLTAIIEYLAEQALYYAAQHAQKRHDNLHEQDSTTPTDESKLITKGRDIVMSAKDMNHIGRDSPLSRLWRSWRRATRTGLDTDMHPVSPEPLPSPSPRPQHHRSASATATPTFATIEEEQRTPRGSMAPAALTDSAVPGMIATLDQIEALRISKKLGGASRSSNRHMSLPAMPSMTMNNLVAGSNIPVFQERSPLRPKWDRRSSSLPNSEATSPILEHDSYFRRVSTSFLPLSQVHALVTTTPREQPSMKALTTSLSDKPQDSNTKLNDNASAFAGATGDAQTVVHQKTLQDESSITHKSIKSALADSQRSTGEAEAPPLTSASISGLADFDTMHVPQGRSSSDSGPPMRTSAVVKEPTSPVTNVDVIDHPNLVKPDYKPPNVYAPTPEPSEQYYAVSQGQPKSSITRDAHTAPPVRSDSPVSIASSRPSHPSAVLLLRDPPAVPDMPQNVAQQRFASKNYQSAHVQSDSLSSSTSNQPLGLSRDLTARPTSAMEACVTSRNGDVYTSLSSRNVAGRASRPGTAASGSTQKAEHIRIHEYDDAAYPGISKEQNKRNLEVLINSNETLHYTLTPAPAAFRPEDIGVHPKRSRTQDLADFFRNTAPPGQEHAPPPAARSMKHSVDGVRAPQMMPIVTSDMSHGAMLYSRGALPASPRSAALKRNPLGQPRDAKIGRDYSTRDLSDYVRSTGPNSTDQLPTAVIRARPSSKNSTSRTGNWVAPTPGNPAPRPPSIPRRNTPSPRPINRLKFQARDARPSRNAESSALIDFIREGPPSGYGGQRAGPSRPAFNSDEDRPLNEVSKSSSSTTGVPSIDTTTSSQAPLLRSGSGPNDTSRSQALQQLQQPPVVGVNGMASTGTRRRVPDPYAIDISDDEIEHTVTGRRERTEESLIDFLRNTAPDPDDISQPTIAGNQNFRGRPTLPQTNGTNSARASSPHLTKSGSKLDSYRPTQLTHASHVERNRLRKHVYSNDDDSAPEPQINRYRPVQIPKEDTGLKKFFSIRGKAR